MGNFLMRALGHKAAHKIVQQHTRRGGIFDAKYGFTLFKDRSIPVTAKLAALGIGVAVTGLLVAIEAPIEVILGIFLPFVGEAADLLVDGLEVVLFPMLIACMILPRLVRQPVYIRQAATINRGEAIDMPPPMID
jgi:hypothetical protein